MFRPHHARACWAHKVRFALTALAVVLGVAFMAGTLGPHRHHGQDLRRPVRRQLRGHRRRGAPARTAAVGDVGDAHERVDAGIVDRPPRRWRQGRSGSVEGLAQVVQLGDGDGQRDRRRRRRPGRRLGDNDAAQPVRAVERAGPAGAAEVVIDRGDRQATGHGRGRHGRRWPGRHRPVDASVGIVTFGDACEGSPGGRGGRHRRRHRAGAGRQPATSTAQRGRRETACQADELVTWIDSVRPPTPRSSPATPTPPTSRRPSGGHALLQHVPMTFAVIALFVGIVHHLQHLLDHRGPAHPGDWPCCGRSAPAAARCSTLGAASRRSSSVLVAPRRSASVAGVGIAVGLRALLAAVGIDIPPGGLVIADAAIVTAIVVGHRSSPGGRRLPGPPGRQGARPSPPCATSAIDSSAASTSAWSAVAVLGAGVTGSRGAGPPATATVR